MVRGYPLVVGIQISVLQLGLSLSGLKLFSGFFSTENEIQNPYWRDLAPASLPSVIFCLSFSLRVPASLAFLSTMQTPRSPSHPREWPVFLAQPVGSPHPTLFLEGSFSSFKSQFVPLSPQETSPDGLYQKQTPSCSLIQLLFFPLRCFTVDLFYICLSCWSVSSRRARDHSICSVPIGNSGPSVE